MLKRTISILIIFVLGGWGTVYYVKNYDKAQKINNKIFSQVTTLNINKISLKKDLNIADIVEATNKERITAGLPPLSINDLLAESAEIKVDDMIKNQYFEHESPKGEGVSDLGSQVGYEYVIMGENLALGNFVDSGDVVQAWMDSPGHRANILSNKYQDIGISVKRANYEGKDVWIAVQHFGTNRSICPNINYSNKNEIDLLNKELKEEELEIGNLKKVLESPAAVNSPTYQTDIRNFNKKVDDYNIKLQASRRKIEEYNSQVKSFNRCIGTFQ